uniref:RHH_1 domain-containing protein n=1 Tax=Macrostomum lignano TaxID=282301 RepID=A0A1I8JLT1_9PLAT
MDKPSSSTAGPGDKHDSNNSLESKRRLRYQKSYSVEIQKHDERRDSLIADAYKEARINEEVARSLEQDEQEASMLLRMKRYATVVKIARQTGYSVSMTVRELLRQT